MSTYSPRNVKPTLYIARWGELSAKLLKHDRSEVKEKAKKDQALGLESLAIQQQSNAVVRQSPTRRYVTLRQVQPQLPQHSGHSPTALLLAYGLLPAWSLQARLANPHPLPPQAVRGSYDTPEPTSLAGSLDSGGLKPFIPAHHSLRRDYRIAIACRGLPKKEGQEVAPRRAPPARVGLSTAANRERPHMLGLGGGVTAAHGGSRRGSPPAPERGRRGLRRPGAAPPGSP